MRADFEGAREYVERLPSPIIRNDFVDRISLGSVLSESSFAEAGLLLNWIQEETSGQRFASKISSTVHTLVGIDPDLSAEWILNMDPGSAVLLP